MLLDAFGQLAEHAEAEGVVIALEPLNRYENHMINTLGQARPLCAEIGSPAPRYRRRHLPHEHRGGRSRWRRWSGGAVDPARPAQRQQPAGAGRRPPGLDRDPADASGPPATPRSWPTSAGSPAPSTRCCRPRSAGSGRRRGHERRRALATASGDGRRSAASGPRSQVLIDNWHGHSTVPSRGLYPHQWSWDSAFIALGLRHWAPRRAATELLSLFGAQWADGRIPHIVFNPAVARRRLLPRPVLLAVGRRRRASAGRHLRASSSRRCTPSRRLAVMPTAWATTGLAFARRIYPCLVAQNDYLRQRRAVGPAGLAVGRASVGDRDGQLPGLGRAAGTRCRPTWRCSTPTPAATSITPATASARPTRTTPATSGWPWPTGITATTTTGCGADGEFLVVDPAFNALWAWSELALAELARHDRGGPGRHHRPRRSGSPPRWSTRCTAPAAGSSWPGTRGTIERLRERTVAGLIPLVLPGLPAVVDAAGRHC